MWRGAGTARRPGRGGRAAQPDHIPGRLSAGSQVAMVHWPDETREEVFGLMSTKASPEPAAAPRELVRVLVVDDEPYITDLVATALRYEGFDVASAATGREALSLVDTFRPGLIVLDVM